MTPTDLPTRPVVTCCACVLRHGRLLLIQRASDPGRGHWSFPGGRLEFGETIGEGIVREMREETGLEVAPLRVFQVYDWITRDDARLVRFHYLVHYLSVQYVSGEPRAGDDAADLRWVSAPELAGLPMHPFVRETAARLLREGASSTVWQEGDGILTGVDRTATAGGRGEALAAGERPAPACSGCVLHAGRLLLIQRAKEPGRGKWEFPGGHLELGETVFEAAQREVLEETGLRVEPTAWAGVHDWPMADETGRLRWHFVISYVRARFLSGEPHGGDDAAQARWLTESEIESLPMYPADHEIALRMVREGRETDGGAGLTDSHLP